METDVVKICDKIVNQFNSKFLTDYKGEKDPEKILSLSGCLDNPSLLSKEVSDIPASYAYWASMRREALQRLDKIKNHIAMWEQSKVGNVVSELNKKGIKTPTQKAIDSQFQLMYRDDEVYKKLKLKLKKADDVHEKILVIEKAVLTKKEVLRIIADITTSMMATGLFIKKPDKKF